MSDTIAADLGFSSKLHAECGKCHWECQVKNAPAALQEHLEKVHGVEFMIAECIPACGWRSPRVEKWEAERLWDRHIDEVHGGSNRDNSVEPIETAEVKG